MKSSLVAILLALSVAQPLEAQEYYGGSWAGIGADFASYTTTWYVYRPGGNSYPRHIFSRTPFLGIFEQRSMFTLGPVHVDGRFELQFGFLGGTREDYLPAGETISEGGLTYGTVALLRFSHPLASSSSLRITPSVGVGFQFTGLNSNGEGVGTQFANRDLYEYGEGWDEFIIGAPVAIGLAIDLSGTVVMAEYRFLLTGGASTDWAPGGTPEDTGPSYEGLVFGLGFQL